MRVLRYGFANESGFPPEIHTPVAFRSGATNSSESAILGSRVCRTTTSLTPSLPPKFSAIDFWYSARLTLALDESIAGSNSLLAVGMTTILALVPPASSTNDFVRPAKCSDDQYPPPRMIVPFFGHHDRLGNSSTMAKVLRIGPKDKASVKTKLTDLGFVLINVSPYCGTMSAEHEVRRTYSEL